MKIDRTFGLYATYRGFSFYIIKRTVPSDSRPLTEDSAVKKAIKYIYSTVPSDSRPLTEDSAVNKTIINIMDSALGLYATYRGLSFQRT